MNKPHTMRKKLVAQIPPMPGQWVTAAALLTLGLQAAGGQEALRYSTASPPAGGPKSAAAEELPYTVKAGDFRMLLTPSLALSWNDNVFTTRNDAKSDFILQPLMGVQMSYPLTAHNQLTLNAGFGYEKYFAHDELSTWLIRSGSQLAFDTYVKDFWINVHDRFDYARDSAREAAVANSAKYGNIDNLVGLMTTWNLQDVVLGVGYDHETVFSPSAEFEYQDRSTELFVGRAGFQINPQLIAGLEVTGALTSYDQHILNDNTAYSLGGYGTCQLGTSFQVESRAGYSIYKFQHTSHTIETSDVDSWYANLTVSHQPTKALNYSLTGGHEARLGVQADMIEDWYVRPGVGWSFSKSWNLNTGFAYEHGRQGVGNVSGNQVETYDWLGSDIVLGYRIMKKMNADLGYRLTVRGSTERSREYTQNQVRLNLTYQFQ